MNNLSGDPRGNLSGAVDAAESETARLVARARTMMVISGLTTVLAVAAVVTVIGYRVYGGGSFGAPSNEVFALPKGARVISMAGTAGRVAVMIDVNGASELHVFDLKTLKESGRLHFSTEP